MDERNSVDSDSKDRISALPDSLIHTILSFIDMRYAVQSCVLSKRWRYIWTSLPMLKFGVEEDYNVADFVDKVLWLRDSCCIQSFFLDACGEEVIDITRVYSWITVAVSRNVEELCFSGRCETDFVMPPCLCTCRSLTKLDLFVYDADAEDNPGKIILPTSVSLPRLKSMNLQFDNLFFDDEYSANKFFSSCPSLESLNLGNCEFSIMNLNICLLKLKCFISSINFESSRSLDNSSFTEAITLALYAPSLTNFRCFYYKLRDYSLENVSSLVTAYISLEVEKDDKVPGNHIELLAEKKKLYARRMMKLVKALHNVKFLTLSEYFKVLSGAPDILDSQLPQFLNLQTLRLTTWLSEDCMLAILFLLKISPNILSLRLDITKIQSNNPSVFPFCDEINNSRSQKDNWDSGLSLPCALYRLKCVMIHGLQGCVNELKLIEILLKNSMVLEEVVLFSAKKDPDAEKRMTKFNEMLLTFPRASTCTFIVNPSDATMVLPSEVFVAHQTR